MPDVSAPLPMEDDPPFWLAPYANEVTITFCTGCGETKWPMDGAYHDTCTGEEGGELVDCVRVPDAAKLDGHVWRTVPLRETITAVLESMPAEAAREHVAAQVELQVRAWLALNAGEVA